MLRNLFKGAFRQMSTATPAYPFSKTAIIHPEPFVPPSKALKQGKGLMPYLQKSLVTPEKQKIINTLFSRRHPQRILPGSVVRVTMEHAPTIFTGVLLGIRRRGPDTSFLLRNIVLRTGVEMQFFVASPHIKDIKVLQKPKKRIRRAKLFYLRDWPSKMTEISAGYRS